MTNFEKWKDTVLEILRKDDGVMPAVIKGIPVSCDATDCRQCEGSVYHGNDINCRVAFFEWLCKEYKEKPKLTKRQKGFLEALQTGWGARDEDGSLYFYEGKPERYTGNYMGSWHFSGKCVPTSYHMLPDFPFINWEDDEPYSIEEMLTWEVEDDCEA